MARVLSSIIRSFGLEISLRHPGEKSPMFHVVSYQVPLYSLYYRWSIDYTKTSLRDSRPAQPWPIGITYWLNRIYQNYSLSRMRFELVLKVNGSGLAQLAPL
jgi:hypothetical protein